MSDSEDSLRRPAKGPRICLAQLSPTLGDTAANMLQHRSAIEQAVSDECDLVVFPELSLCGYRLKDSVPDVAISRGSDTWKELEELSKQVAFVVGFVEESPDHHFYNSAAYFEDGNCLAVHRKTYLPTYGMFDEQRYFARGRSIAAFDTARCGRVAILICEDMLHPSAVTIAVCDGATLIVVPSVSPARGVVGASGEHEADGNARSWEAYLQVMARSFGVQVAYCNRVGVEDGVTFWGGSELVSAAGERLAKAAYYDEDQVEAVLSEDAVRRRRIANPLVRDEDLDLTINELSRIRGRAVEQRDEAPALRPRRDFGDAPSRPRRDDSEGRPRRDDGEGPPRRAYKPRSFDGPRFGGGEEREGGFRPRGPFEQRGGFGRPRRDEEGGEGSDAPRGRFGPRDGGDAPRARFAPRAGSDAPRGRFAPRDGGDAPRGRFAPREGGDAPRGRFAPREGGDAPRGRFGAAPRGRFESGGGFGPPRGRFSPGARDDREAGGGRGGFDEGPRHRQRPEPTRKPFHKGGKPTGRGRKG